MGLVYRDQLFPRPAYARAFEAMIKKLPPGRLPHHGRSAGPGARASVRGELAERLDEDLDAGRLPDLKRLRALFSPEAAAVPAIVVSYAPLSAYEELARTPQGEVA